MCEFGCDAKNIRICLAELGFYLNTASSPYCKRTASNNWAENADSTKRAKHVELECHFVVKVVAKNGIIGPRYFDSDKNPADGFTKPLQKIKFENFRDLIGVKL